MDNSAKNENSTHANNYDANDADSKANNSNTNADKPAGNTEIALLEYQQQQITFKFSTVVTYPVTTVAFCEYVPVM